MSRKFEFIEHTADLGFRAHGTTMEMLFAHAGEAFTETIVALESIREMTKRPVEVEADALEDLMVAWLGELLYLFETKGLLFKRFEIDRIQDNRLKATAGGEVFDPSRHEVKTVIKAVTYHQLYIKKRAAGWEAQVIFDI